MKLPALTFDIENVTITLADSVIFHALISDNNRTFDRYIQEVRQLALKCKVYWFDDNSSWNCRTNLLLNFKEELVSTEIVT